MSKRERETIGGVLFVIRGSSSEISSSDRGRTTVFAFVFGFASSFRLVFFVFSTEFLDCCEARSSVEPLGVVLASFVFDEIDFGGVVDGGVVGGGTVGEVIDCGVIGWAAVSCVVVRGVVDFGGVVDPLVDCLRGVVDFGIASVFEGPWSLVGVEVGIEEAVVEEGGGDE